VRRGRRLTLNSNGNKPALVVREQGRYTSMTGISNNHNGTSSELNEEEDYSPA